MGLAGSLPVASPANTNRAGTKYSRRSPRSAGGGQPHRPFSFLLYVFRFVKQFLDLVGRFGFREGEQRESTVSVAIEAVEVGVSLFDGIEAMFPAVDVCGFGWWFWWGGVLQPFHFEAELFNDPGDVIAVGDDMGFGQSEGYPVICAGGLEAASMRAKSRCTARSPDSPMAWLGSRESKNWRSSSSMVIFVPSVVWRRRIRPR